MVRWGNGAGGETRTPNRPITNRVLYQLSHASDLRLFSRDFRLVNSSNAKTPAFNETCVANPDYFVQLALTVQNRRLTAGHCRARVALLKF